MSRGSLGKLVLGLGFFAVGCTDARVSKPTDGNQAAISAQSGTACATDTDCGGDETLVCSAVANGRQCEPSPSADDGGRCGLMGTVIDVAGFSGLTATYYFTLSTRQDPHPILVGDDGQFSQLGFSPCHETPGLGGIVFSRGGIEVFTAPVDALNEAPLTITVQEPTACTDSRGAAVYQGTCTTATNDDGTTATLFCDATGNLVPASSDNTCAPAYGS